MVWVLVGVRGCVLRPMEHSLVTLFSLSVSVKDRPLHWALDKSQTYYPEHILGYGRMKGLLLSCRGSFLIFLKKNSLFSAYFFRFSGNHITVGFLEPALMSAIITAALVVPV